MAIAVTETRKLPGLRSIRSVGNLVFSGNYATGGEVVALPKPGTTKDPYAVKITGESGHQYLYKAATGKIQILTAAGVELAAAAYPAGVTGDTITYDAEYPKLG